MAIRDAPHRLTAILSARFIGRALLQRDDDGAGIRTLTGHLKVMLATIAAARGRVADTPGDTLQAEFAGAEEAVDCAVAIQRRLMALNAGIADRRRVQAGIGIHLAGGMAGETPRDGRAAAVADGLADLAGGDGICISGAVMDRVEKMVGLEFASAGTPAMKGFDGPDRTYRIRFAPEATACRRAGDRQSARRQTRQTRLAILVLFLAATLLVIWNRYH